MRFTLPLLIVVIVSSAASPVSAQRFLDQLEGVLDAEADAAAKRPEPPAARKPGYLGLVAVEQDGGVKVESVREAAPADRAGILAGDVITAVDDRAVAKLDDLGAALARHFAGDRAAISVQRGGRRGVLVVTLGAKPAVAEVDEVPPEPDPFAPEAPHEPAEVKSAEERAAPAEVPVDAIDALRTLEAILDDEAPAAEPPEPKIDTVRKKRISALENELEAIRRHMRALEKEIANLAGESD